MRRRVLFVHGVGASRIVAGELAAWTAALAEGGRLAGHGGLGDLLRGCAGVGYAHYGDLFVAPTAGGAGAREEPDGVRITADLAREAIDVQLAQEQPANVHAVLLRARAELDPPFAGAGDLAGRLRSAADALLEAPRLRRGGQWLSGAEMLNHLSQIGRYLAREPVPGTGTTLDRLVRDRVLDALGPEPVIVIGHSLGAVVALEALHEYGGEVPLLVTLGSPLAMRSVVQSRVHPLPPSTPPGVEHWVDAWDQDDVVASRPLLDSDVTANVRGARPSSRRIDRIGPDGVWVHSATRYLAQAAVAAPVAEALAVAGGRV